MPCHVGSPAPDPFLRRLVRRQLAGHATLAHHHDAVAHAQDLRQLRGNHDDRLALVGERSQKLVDLALGADVDAARGLVEEQDIAIAIEPFGDHDLLLVATRKQPHFLRRRRRADVEQADEFLRRPAHRLPLEKAGERQIARQVRHHDIGLDVHAERKPEALAVLGEIADARGNRVLRGADRAFLAVYIDLARLRPVGAEHGACDLRAAGAHQPGKSQNLAAAHRKTHVANQRAAVEMADVEHDLAGLARADHARVADRAPDHHADDRCYAGGRGVDGADIFAVTQHRDPVGDLLQLVHLVRDIDDADAAALQLADDLEQLRDLGAVERGRRLVHDQHARVEGQGLGDLHHLLLGDGETADDGARVDCEIEVREQRRGVAVELVVVEQQAERARRLAADEDVLRDG